MLLDINICDNVEAVNYNIFSKKTSNSCPVYVQRIETLPRVALFRFVMQATNLIIPANKKKERWLDNSIRLCCEIGKIVRLRYNYLNN